MTRKIALAGLGPLTSDQTPVKDPSWEVWGLPWDSWAWEYERLFEIHDWEVIQRPAAQHRPDYIGHLNELSEIKPIYFQEVPLDVPLGKRFPLEDVAYIFDRIPREDYYGSTISYMFALAIHELTGGGYEVANSATIGLFGLDLQGDFEHERHNLNFFTGYAAALGITIEVAKGSALLDLNDTYRLGREEGLVYPQRYGWLA